MGFTIAVIGLGLMGGSFAYALRGFRDCVLTGYDLRPEIMAAALENGAVDKTAPSAPQAAANADLCLFCADPVSILAGVESCAAILKPGSVVSEICGVKRDMVKRIPALLPPNVHYIGLHPMAGKEVGGFAQADKKLFQKAGFILVPPDHPDPGAMELLRELSVYAGAGRVLVNNAREHDALIAYSSDLPHIAATALVRSYPGSLTLAHTAGAFRDCTRVANIDADLWTELLLDNGEPVLPHLQTYIEHLQGVSDALERKDRDALHGFLTAAGQNKRRIQTL